MWPFNFSKPLSGVTRSILNDLETYDPEAWVITWNPSRGYVAKHPERKYTITFYNERFGLDDLENPNFFSKKEQKVLYKKIQELLKKKELAQLEKMKQEDRLKINKILPECSE